jgi:hypothetical protein
MPASSAAAAAAAARQLLPQHDTASSSVSGSLTSTAAVRPTHNSAVLSSDIDQHTDTPCTACTACVSTTIVLANLDLRSA